jgi:hypothetical protein
MPRIILWIFVVLIVGMVMLPFIKNQDAFYEGPEARAWLENNKNPIALASRHFNSTQAAIAFVDSVYAQGAEAVLISRKCLHESKSDDGPYANGIVVRLPADHAKRLAVIKLCDKELPIEQRGDLEKGIRHGMVLLLWN